MNQEYTSVPAWLEAATTLNGSGGSTIQSCDDILTRSLGFRHNGVYHFVSLRTVRTAPDEMRLKLATPESRQKLLEG